MSRDYSVILKSILSAAASSLNAAGRPPGRVELTPGLLPAWDDCCEGQLYVRMIEAYPTAGQNAPFPAIDVQQRGVGAHCGFHLLAVHIGLGIIRCAATVDDQGNPPTSAEVTADADALLEDMADLLDVLVCESQGTPGIQALKIDRWTPSGPEGGCAGGEWGAYIALDPCLCKPIPEE